LAQAHWQGACHLSGTRGGCVMCSLWLSPNMCTRVWCSSTSISVVHSDALTTKDALLLAVTGCLHTAIMCHIQGPSKHHWLQSYREALDNDAQRSRGAAASASANMLSGVELSGRDGAWCSCSSSSIHSSADPPCLLQAIHGQVTVLVAVH
jgi:hypothetical protein